MFSGKIKNLFSVFLFATSFAILYSCTHEPGVVDVVTPVPPEPLPPCEPNKVYFQNQVMPYINTSCCIPGCHDKNSPAAQIDLSSYEAIMASKIKGVPIVKPGDPLNSRLSRSLYALDLALMPPIYKHPLIATGRDNIVKWISEGATNEICETRTDTTKYTFRRDINPILEKYCKGCHFGKYAYGGFELITYAQIKKQVDSSRLLESILAQNGLLKMPTGNVTVQPDEITQIRKWIEDGALNN
jgi:hypothetical protein